MHWYPMQEDSEVSTTKAGLRRSLENLWCPPAFGSRIMRMEMFKSSGIGSGLAA